MKRARRIQRAALQCVRIKLEVCGRCVDLATHSFRVQMPTGKWQRPLCMQCARALSAEGNQVEDFGPLHLEITDAQHAAAFLALASHLSRF